MPRRIARQQARGARRRPGGPSAVASIARAAPAMPASLSSASVSLSARRTRQRFDLLIVFAHWAEHVNAPSGLSRAAACLRMTGADLVAGYSAHGLDGVGWNGGPTLFDLADKWMGIWSTRCRATIWAWSLSAARPELRHARGRRRGCRLDRRPARSGLPPARHEPHRPGEQRFTIEPPRDRDQPAPGAGSVVSALRAHRQSRSRARRSPARSRRR
jgi:hypothetical protein